jgi:hypothetical protein
MTSIRQTCRARSTAWVQSARPRGYTVIELLMSLAVLAAGITSVIAMQKVTLASNSHAKNLALATHVAQSWLGVVNAESALWNESGNFARTPFLMQANTNAGNWFRPTYDAGEEFGAAFDALGNPLPAGQEGQARFCVDLRMVPLQGTTGSAGLSRVEVRVVWPRESRISTAVAAPTSACAFATAAVEGTDNAPHLHFLFVSGAIRQVARGRT